MHAVRWLAAGVGLMLLAGVAVARHTARSPLLYTVAGPFKAVAMDAAAGRAFLVDPTETTLSILDSRTGRLLRTLPEGGDLDALDVDARRGRVFVATHIVVGSSPAVGLVEVLDARSGATLGGWPTGSDPDVLAVDAQRGQVAVVDDDASVSLLDEHSGAVRHRTWLGVGLSALGIDERAGHLCAVNGTRGTVSLLDERSGALLRTVVAGQSLDRLAVDGRRHRAYITDVSANSVSVLDTRTGQLVRRVGVAPNPTAVAVDERSGRVFVTSQGALDAAGDPLGPGVLTVLDARSGDTVGTLEVGLAPSAVAADERTGAVLVVSAGGTVSGRDAWDWLPSWLRPLLPLLPRPAPRDIPSELTALDPSRA